MKFYKREPLGNIVQTLALSMTEEGALIRLEDWYLYREEPIPHASRFEVARALTRNEREAVDHVLQRFFISDGQVWRSAALDRVITNATYAERFGHSPKSWSTSGYQAVFERDGRACRYCGSEEALSIDHVVPRCQGGLDNSDNLVVACRSCNSRKGGRTPEQAGMVLQ